MSQVETLTFNPPRYATAPTQPLPQTCLGTVEHSGLSFSDPLNVTDIPPDFGWMTQFQHYLGTFEYSSTTPLRKTVWKAAVMGDNELVKIRDVNHPWVHLPFTTSKWWNGIPSFKFIAIKPPRTTGKLLVRYHFTQRSEVFQDDIPENFPDTLRRGVSKEWDLGQSNIFEFDISNLNTVQAKMTWIPNTAPYSVDADITPYASQLPIYTAYGMGMITVEPAQKYQPGGIFPDSVRIQVFRVFKNANFYIPTDPRSNQLHTLGTGLQMLSVQTNYDDQS
jgi:hypothetical protein